MRSADKLVAAFEAGQIDSADFPHERHVRVAWGLAQRYPAEKPCDGSCPASKGLPPAQAEPTPATRRSCGWFELIAAADHLADHPELFDKTLLGQYYTPGRLAAGRKRWLEPDVHPVGLPRRR